MAAPTITQKDTTFTKIFVGGLPYHTTGMMFYILLFAVLLNLPKLIKVITHLLTRIEHAEFQSIKIFTKSIRHWRLFYIIKHAESFI